MRGHIGDDEVTVPIHTPAFVQQTDDMSYFVELGCQVAAFGLESQIHHSPTT